MYALQTTGDRQLNTRVLLGKLRELAVRELALVDEIAECSFANSIQFGQPARRDAPAPTNGIQGSALRRLFQAGRQGRYRLDHLR